MQIVFLTDKLAQRGIEDLPSLEDHHRNAHARGSCDER